MAQQLRKLTAPVEAQTSVASTHVCQLTTAYNTSSRRTDTSATLKHLKLGSCTQKHMYMCARPHACTHT